MKLHRANGAGLWLLGVTALALVAPVAAHAGSSWSAYVQYGAPQYGGGRAYVGAPYRIYPDENRWGRSYHYEDPYSGARSAYLSDLTSLYGQPGHGPLVYMIDNRTGWVINTYAWQNGRWCDVAAGLVSVDQYGWGGAYGGGYDRQWYGGHGSARDQYGRSSYPRHGRDRDHD